MKCGGQSDQGNNRLRQGKREGGTRCALCVKVKKVGRERGKKGLAVRRGQSGQPRLSGSVRKKCGHTLTGVLWGHDLNGVGGLYWLFGFNIGSYLSGSEEGPLGAWERDGAGV